MAQLAIKGHATRGREVIEILEMLGGINKFDLDGNTYAWYVLEEGRTIRWCELILEEKGFILEEFLEKFPYKVGDKVMTDDRDKANIVGMIWDNDINDVFYEIQICNEVFKYPKELLQPYKEETIEKDKNNWAKWDLPDGYEFQDKEGNVINTDVIKLVKIQPQYQYPKTYEECWSVLIPNDERYIDIDVPLDYNKSLFAFTELLICRKAYWKIAVDEMGLDKPWRSLKNDNVYCIFRLKGEIVKDNFVFGDSLILEFPTEEMRDAFYENFKDLIEECKEFL